MPKNLSVMGICGGILMFCGGAVAIQGFLMDTTISDGLIDRIHHTGLMNERTSRIQFGGFAFVGGTIVYGFSKKSEA